MTVYKYSQQELDDRRSMTEIQATLVQNKQTLLRHLELVNTQIRNLGRCQDGWTAEVLFRRGIAIDGTTAIRFHEDSMEVSDESL